MPRYSKTGLFDKEVFMKNVKIKNRILFLFFALCVFNFIPLLSQSVRSILLSYSGTSGFDLSGHLEWFDLTDETMQAFLVVPLYCLLGKYFPSDITESKKKLSQILLFSIAVYAIFTLITFAFMPGIVETMTSENVSNVSMFLRIELLSYLPGIVAAIMMVLIVLLGKPVYIWETAIVKALLSVLIDTQTVTRYGSNGAAITDILVSIGLCINTFLILKHENLLPGKPELPTKETLKELGKIGVFSGLQTFLSNIIYALIVCRMIASFSEQGNYWVANNVIWGILIPPLSALTSVISKEIGQNRFSKETDRQIGIILLIILIWWMIVPLWKYYTIAYGGDYAEISRYLTILIPFYVPYAVSAVIDAYNTGRGNTKYMLICSAVVNLIYYPICYYLFTAGIWEASITSVCLLFSFGMLINMIINITCMLIEKKTKKTKFLMN